MISDLDFQARAGLDEHARRADVALRRCPLREEAGVETERSRVVPPKREPPRPGWIGIGVDAGSSVDPQVVVADLCGHAEIELNLWGDARESPGMEDARGETNGNMIPVADPALRAETR